MEENAKNQSEKSRETYEAPHLELFHIELEGVISSSKPITPDIGDNGSPNTQTYRTSFPTHEFGED